MTTTSPISIFVEPPSDDLCAPLDLGDGGVLSGAFLDRVNFLLISFVGWIRLSIPLAMHSSCLVLMMLNETSPIVCSLVQLNDASRLIVSLGSQRHRFEMSGKEGIDSLTLPHARFDLGDYDYFLPQTDSNVISSLRLLPCLARRKPSVPFWIIILQRSKISDRGLQSLL